MARITTSCALFASCILLGITACQVGDEGVYVEAEDVSFDLPDSGFRADGVTGDASWLVDQTAKDVNSWVASVVEGTSYVVEFLDNHAPSEVEDGWRVYGPFDANDGGVAWLIRVTGDQMDTAFEFLLAPPGTQDTGTFELLFAGSLNIDGDVRSGDVHIDFDTLESYPALDTTLLWSFAGDITIEFERDLATGEKTIELAFDEFHADRTGYLDDDSFSSDETYRYHKAGDGSGDFHLALMGEWDTWPHTWSGPEQERMALDMVWQPGGAGRTLGTITEIDGQGDMKYGDLSLDECFDGTNILSYRALTTEYANEVPGYNFGDPATCVLEF